MCSSDLFYQYKLQVKGYDSAKYKSFDNREEAERAFAASPYAYIGKNAKKKITGPIIR